MTTQCYLMDLSSAREYNEVKSTAKAKALYYEEKAVGTTSFYKCEACPYMALAEDDIKFHIFTVHPDIAKSNGLGENIHIPCPGCSEVFDTETTIRVHLREHHKMGIRDVRKMVKSLILIALKNTKSDPVKPVSHISPRTETVQIPQVIEIVPDIIQSNNAALPSGVTIISVEELKQMSAPNFEKVDPKEIIQEASINIVYSEELASNHITSSVVSGTGIQNSTPDLISSIQTSAPTQTVISSREVDTTTPNFIRPGRMGRPFGARSCGITEFKNKSSEVNDKFGKQCTIGNCGVRMVSDEKYAYHISCHQNGRLQCPECKTIFHYVKPLHTHLWIVHNIDMELNACDECDYKTYSLNRLNNIHKMTHKKIKDHPCPVCGKFFKSSHQMIVHKRTHNKSVCCSVCLKELASQRELNRHIAAVHEHRKPFKCGECDYAATTKSLLKLHIRSHTGEKPYKCTDCSYRSSDHNALRRHKMQHSKQSQYSCKLCPYTSIQSKSYKAHMSSEHPNVRSNDIFPCPYCPYKSVGRVKLINHLCSHKEEGVKQMLIELKKSEPQKIWTTPSGNQAKINRNIQCDNQQKQNWNTPSESIAGSNWNTPAENQTKTNWNASKESQLITNWNSNESQLKGNRNSPSESHPTSNWVTPSDSQNKPNWNSRLESETKGKWSTGNDCLTKPNWNTSSDNQPITKSHWNTPSENQPEDNWNACLNQPNTIRTPSSGSQLSQQNIKTDKVELHGCNQQGFNPVHESDSNVEIAIEVDDCDSEHDTMNKNYPTDYSYTKNSGEMNSDKAYHLQEILTDLTKDDNNSDCMISESSMDTVNERLQCFSQHTVPNVSYSTDMIHADKLHYLSTTVPMGESSLQNSTYNIITSSNTFTSSNLSSSFMSNLPIHLPPNPRITIRRNLTLTPLDKIPLPVPKVMGPIITQNQILPIPPSSNSPVNQITQQSSEEGVPRKKAKISVKSNLILKGPDQINMFEAEQNMAFARLQENEGLDLSSPVTFNNLITTQFMQLPPEPVLTNNPETILSYTPEPMTGDSAVPQSKDNRPIFTFNRQIDLNSINLLSQQVEHNKMSIICGNPSFIKLESKQNIQSPSLERMCSANSMIKTQENADEYCKASPLLEDLQKNVNDIKNEIKTDTYFNMTLTAQSSPTVMDQHLIDTIIGANELYAGHLDLSGVVIPELSEDQQPDIIEIDDNSEDNKLLPPRFDMSFPVEYSHSDFYFMEGDLSQPCTATKMDTTETVSELNRLASEVAVGNQSKEVTGAAKDTTGNNFENFIHGKKDPMMNTCVRPAANKINVKNIELMKN